MASETKKDWYIVGAIDFGTTYSGYAYSFEKDSEPIVSKTWYSGLTQLATPKTPTCLLLYPDKSFFAFGFEAQTKYAAMAGDKEHQNYYYFENFKMALHNIRGISDDYTISDIREKKLPAILVFSLAIEYLKNHLLGAIKDTLGKETNDGEVLYVLTVPAIWNDSAKHFMRMAATDSKYANIDNDRLLLALEPEAASVYCQKVHMNNLQSEEGVTISVTGTKYLIADIGGGTADFTVHEKNKDGSLTEIHRATGGAFGGIYVDSEYKCLIEKIVGKDVVNKLKDKEMEDYLDFFQSFEMKKRTVTGQKQDQRIIARFSEAFKDLCEKGILFFKDTLKDKTTRAFSDDEASVNGDKLNIKDKLLRNLFSKSITGIVEQIKQILKRCPNVSAIVLVGGYGESEILQDELKKEFNDKIFIIPESAQLAVVKGAAMFGHNPMIVSERVMKYTYGTDVCQLFIPGTHDETRKFTSYGTEYCSGTFYELIKAGTRVKYNSKILNNIAANENCGRTICTNVYYTEDKNKMYIDERCHLVGKITVSIPEEAGQERELEESYSFGHTEIKVQSTVLDTGEVVQMDFDLPE